MTSVVAKHIQYNFQKQQFESILENIRKEVNIERIISTFTSIGRKRELELWVVPTQDVPTVEDNFQGEFDKIQKYIDIIFDNPAASEVSIKVIVDASGSHYIRLKMKAPKIQGEKRNYEKS